MPNHIAMGAATWWDPLVAVGLTLAAIAALVVLGGRVYTRAILHTGATLSLRDAWHGAPLRSHPKASVTPESADDAEVRAETQPTTRDMRTQLVLTIIAVAVGGVVFALTGDFVIGVGVGAAIFALARQGTKLWGRTRQHQSDEPLHSSRDAPRSRRGA
jgi:hypothetical protein